jgi:NAD-dependent deacetylase
MMSNEIGRAGDALSESKKAVALTGAGISAESGIPHFRGKNGLWSKYDPEEYTHIDAFLSNPKKVWKMLEELGKIIENAKPNPAHFALAELEKLGVISSIITQNIDGLHQDAGSKKVIEFHGSHRYFICMWCGKRIEAKKVSMEKIPPECECGKPLKPDIVLFGEPIPQNSLSQSFREAESCDLMFVIGTSAVVAPASSLPILAKQNGAKIIEINPSSTHLTDSVADITIFESSGVALPKIVEIYKAKKMDKHFGEYN